jgi:very-short-patch-repair endonuclease
LELVEFEVCSAGGGVDRAIGAVAARQRGQITRRQLRALGMSRAVIDRWVARGRLIPRHRAVYALAHLALPAFADEMAAVLTYGDYTFASHESAAAIWAIRCPKPRRGEVQVTVAGHRRASRPGIAVHYTRCIDQFDGWIRNGIPVTSAARTLVDLAPRLSLRDLERALDGALTDDLVTLKTMRWALHRAGPKRGTAALRALVDDDRPASFTRSENEERMLQLCRRAGLPAPEVNVPLGRFVIDFLWREERVAVEIDSYRYHHTRLRFQQDRAKDAYLHSLAIRPLRFSDLQLAHEQEVLLVRLSQSLVSAPAELGSRRAAGS